jgi:hypothetical protein
MPAIVRTSALLTATSNPNVLSGSTFEYARTRAILSMGLTQSATGMFALFNVGSDIVAEEFEPPIATVYPIIPDDFYFQDIAEAGDRIVVALRNPTGGTLTGRTIVIITNA